MEPRIHRACRVMGKLTKKPEKTVKGRTLEALEKSAVTHMADVSGKMSETDMGDPDRKCLRDISKGGKKIWCVDCKARRRDLVPP